jgi:beta-glucosidase
MSAYNKLNGTFCGENPDLLMDILRDEWDFEGIVMSDWFGTKSTGASVNGGQDLEMPGPPQWRGKKLLKAVQDGEVNETIIDERVRSMLRTIIKTGAFENPEDPPERAVDLPEHREVARQAATEGIVLLKNAESLLPLNLSKLNRIALIGPNVKTAQIMGGGSSQVNAHYIVSPFEGIAAKVGDDVKIGYEIGCTNHKSLPRLDNRLLTPAGGEDGSGFTAEFFNSLDLSGDVAWRTVAQGSEQIWFGDFAPQVDTEAFSARFTGKFTAEETGEYRFGLLSAGLSRFYVNGEELIDNWTEQERGDALFGTGSAEVTAGVEMQEGQTVDLRIDYTRQGASALAGFRLGCLPPVAEDSVTRAVALASDADVALLFVGLNSEWESEGHDRPNMDLVGEQDELVERVAEANPNTVVVLQTGSPISMPWGRNAATPSPISFLGMPTRPANSPRPSRRGWRTTPRISIIPGRTGWCATEKASSSVIAITKRRVSSRSSPSDTVSPTPLLVTAIYD